MPSKKTALSRQRLNSQQDKYLRSLHLQRLSVDEKWADIHFVYVILFSMFCIFTESFVFVLQSYFGIGTFILPSSADYISLYIFTPSMLQFAVVVIMFAVRTVTDDLRIRSLAYSAAGAASFFVVYVIHSRWTDISLGFMLPLMTTVGYANILVTSITAFVVFIARIVSDFWVLPLLPYAHLRLSGDADSLINFSLGSSTIVMAWLVCILFIYVEKTRENEIRRSDREKAEMFRRVITDPMTGVGNRLAMRLQFNEIIAEGTQQHCAAVMMDMDHFKSINDTLGHAMGDRYIKTLAGILADIEDAGAFRFGGDEFCLLIKRGGVRRAEAVCREIAARLLSSEVCREVRPITMSAGIARWKPEISPFELLKRADTALYTAKEVRGRAVVYTEEQQCICDPNEREIAAILS